MARRKNKHNRQTTNPRQRLTPLPVAQGPAEIVLRTADAALTTDSAASSPISLRPANVTIGDHVSEFVSRIGYLSVALFLLCFAGVVAMYFCTPPLTLFALLMSLALAGFLTLPATFFRQSRFHYRYLLMNESVSRFVGVFASVILARIWQLGEAGHANLHTDMLILGIFLIASISFYCVSVFFTNSLKAILNDPDRHLCEQKTIVYMTKAVPQEEGFGQKKCAKTTDASWYIFRSELDRITNLNIQTFLTFFLITTGLILYFSLRTPIAATAGSN